MHFRSVAHRLFKILSVLQIRTEDMDLIAERGIAAHYSGRGVVSGPVRPGISSGRNSKGKVICLNNTGFALRVLYVLYYNHTDVFTAYCTSALNIITSELGKNLNTLPSFIDWLAQCNPRMARRVCW